MASIALLLRGEGNRRIANKECRMLKSIDWLPSDFVIPCSIFDIRYSVVDYSQPPHPNPLPRSTEGEGANRFATMKLVEIDHWCDCFEERVKRGDEVSVDEFLDQQRLPRHEELLIELRKVESEFRVRSTSVSQPTEAVSANDRAKSCEVDVETEIGPYRLLETLGEGGMGRVYLAQQTTPVARRVALKLIKPGMDSTEIIGRFESERQALARMDHPHIARVLDAGTTASGRPYFVMELVQGSQITRYCNEGKLSLRARLELFVFVCQAIQHAHHREIIHRDIKPSNVLVTTVDGRPLPKVIDFGLAKILDSSLDDHTLFTQHGQLIGTLDYMSPEQASMRRQDIDTRTDVYSLGVLLYELLTGSTLIDAQQRRSGVEEILRLIKDAAAYRPSLELRNEAIAGMVLMDFRVDRQWDGCPGPPDEFPSFAFDAEALRYARSDKQGNVSLRQVENDRELAVLPGNGYTIKSMQFSPRGDSLALIRLGFSGVENTLLLWNIAGDEPKLILETSVVAFGVGFSPDGSELAVSKLDDCVEMVGIPEGNVVRSLPAVFAWFVEYSPDGKSVAFVERPESHVDVRDALTGVVLARIESPKEQLITAIVWHPDGKSLAIGCGNRIALANVQSQTIDRWLDGHPERVINGLNYNHQGDLLVSTCDAGRVVFWDANNHSLLLSGTDAHQRGIACTHRFRQDDHSLPYFIIDGKLQTWQVADRTDFEEVDCPGVTSVALHPQQRLLAIADGQSVRFRDIWQRKELGSVALADVREIQFHPDGSSVVATTKLGLFVVRIESLSAAEDEGFRVQSPQLAWNGPFLEHVAFSSDGRKLVVTRGNAACLRFDWERMNEPVSLPDDSIAASICFSADNQSFAMTSHQKRGADIRSVLTGERNQVLEPVESAAHLAISQDDRWLVSSDVAGYRLWNLRDHKCVLHLPLTNLCSFRTWRI